MFLYFYNILINRTLKKFIIIIARVLLSLLATVLLIWLLLQTELVQNFIVSKVTKRLSKDLNTEVRIKHVSFAFFNRMNLEGTLVRDQTKDTLLYANNIKVRVTDWFFLQDTLVLKFIGLEDTKIKLQRRDSIWNYQFLIDHFSPTSPKKTNKSKLILDLKKLDFNKVEFVQNDLWTGKKLLIKLGSLQLDADNFSMVDKRLNISQLDLDRPYIAMIGFKGLKPAIIKKTQVKSDTGYYFNPANMELKIGKLNIKNGTFINEKYTDRLPYPIFDGQHLRFDKITGALRNISFVKDTIKVQVDLAAKERSGFDVKRLKTDFRLTPQIMEFARLDLVTPKSHLRNYYAMNFKDFNKDFSDFMHKVSMSIKFTDATIDSDDLAYFTPAAKNWNRKISIWGTSKGPVDDLDMKGLFIRAGANTYVKGDLSMTGLPDIKNTLISFRSGTIKTNYRDATLFIPALAKITSPSLPSLGYIQYTGSFNGTTSQFVTAGNVSTNLGAFSTNLTIKLPANNIPIYSGKIMTRQFNLGKFIQSPQLGIMAFDGAIKGSGFTLSNLRTTVMGKFQQFDFNGYNYKNIVVEGTFQRRQFDGSVKIDDENLNLTTTVKIDLTNDQPRFNVLGDLAESNFKNLNFSNRNIQLTGLFDLDFSGKNIDQFLGSVKIFNASLLQDSVRINVDSLTLLSQFVNNQRSLLISSNEFDANITGIYNILDLPLSFQVFLHKYYPAYINAPRSEPKNQRFTFAVNTKNVEDYAPLINKDITGFSYSSLSGNINTIDTIFTLNANIPYFAFKKYSFTNANFTGKGNLNNLQLLGDIEQVRVSDSTTFPNTKISILSQKDVSQLSLQTKASSTLNELNLNADVTTLSDGVRVKFSPSNFVINDKRWVLEKEGEIVLRKRFVSADNVRFTQGDQVIEIGTQHDSDFDQSSLVVKLSNLNLSDFAPFITKDPRLEGLASGQIVLNDFYGNFNANVNLKASQFRLDNDSIGIVIIDGRYAKSSGMVNFKISSPNELYNFMADGSYNLKDSTGRPLQTSFKLNNTRITIVNKFLNTVFTNINGLATGELQLNGNFKSPELLGKIKIKDASLLVNFTKVRYQLDSAYFVFSDGVMDFGNFKIRDKFGNTGNVTGKLYQRNFKNIRYDFDISTQRMLLIDTKANDNAQFYGTAIGKASLRLSGPQENMRMQISGEPTDSSHIYIPLTTTKESADADFIVFKQYGTEMKLPGTFGGSNIVVDLDLTANPLAKIDVILDELTGDIIKANGFGRLKIHAGTKDNLTINGRYEIQKGSYDFNFQSFIRKPFILKEDAGSFIEWNGDPYNARINIEALYVAENVRLGDLVGNQNLGGAVQGYKGDVYVIANLTDNLKKPTIKFRLDFPTGTQVKNDETFNQFLTKVEQDDNEMLKQVTYLIVFGQFAPYGEGRNIGSNFTTLGFNTISEMISKQVNNVVSNLLYKITGDRSLQFDVSTSLYNSSSLFSGNVTASNIDRQQVNFKLGYGLFNNKVIITFGGDLDFKMGSNTSTSQALGNVQWLPDLTVEIVLTKDRRLRAIVFSRNNLDISSGDVGRRNRQGVSISYRKDFPNIITETKPIANKPKDTILVAGPAIQ